MHTSDKTIMTLSHKVLYLRTDIVDQPLTAGGSVAHTLGVIKGFNQLGWKVYCAASCMQALLQELSLEQCVCLGNPKKVAWLRWKLNSFLSTIFFFRQVAVAINVVECDIIYQRYSILNATGVLLAWWYKKPFILECNGSEVWVIQHWNGAQPWLQLFWLVRLVERINFRYANLIVVVSEPLQEMLIQQYGILAEKILINPNGVDADLFFSTH